MDALKTAFDAVLPTFLLVAVGALADRLPRLDVDTLARLSVHVLIPALVLDALIGSELSLGGAGRLAAAYLLYLLLLGLVARAAATGLATPQQRALLAAGLFGNTGNMGLPITLFAYGAAGLERALVILVVSLVAMFALGPALLATDDERRRGLGRLRLGAALRLPPIWATLLAVALNLLGWQLPLGLERGVSLLGQAAIPIMLLSLGIQMRRSWVWAVDGAAVRATVVRLLAGPVVAYLAARLMGLPQLDLVVLVLSAAMPSAVTLFVVAVEVGGDARAVARSVVATTLASLLAILAVLTLFPGA